MSAKRDHKLHVASARSLGTSQGNLLAQIGSRYDLLGERDTIVVQEEELKSVAHNRVIVDDAGDVVDELDDLLGHVVAGRRLAADHDDARDELAVRIASDAVVERYDV